MSAQGRELAIEYTSPIAIAQRAVQANVVLQGLSIGAQLAQFDQSVPMLVDANAIFKDQLKNTYVWPDIYAQMMKKLRR